MGSRNKFTREQMIVVAVWYHEKQYTLMTMFEIQEHFLKRFGMEGPSDQSILNWEKRLFASRNVDATKNLSKHRLNRLVYVPYILESFKLYPDVSMRRRSEILGMNSSTLHNIMRDDMKEYLPAKKTVPESSHGKQDKDESQISNKKAVKKKSPHGKQDNDESQISNKKKAVKKKSSHGKQDNDESQISNKKKAVRKKTVKKVK